GPGPRLIRPHADADVDARVPEVQGPRAALVAVADDRDRGPRERRRIGVALVENVRSLGRRLRRRPGEAGDSACLAALLRSASVLAHAASWPTRGQRAVPADRSKEVVGDGLSPRLAARLAAALYILC